jgi:hypothetical protein
MNPLLPFMYGGLHPDSRRMSQDAAERHRLVTERAVRGHVPRAHVRAWHTFRWVGRLPLLSRAVMRRVSGRLVALSQKGGLT